jgi:hypothetical protein
MFGHHGTGVVWEIDGERGVHRFLRVIRGRVFDQRDLVAQLSGIPHRGLHARVGDEPHDDELVDTMLFELQIQIRIGKAAGPPMLVGHDVARVRRELAAVGGRPWRQLLSPRRRYSGSSPSTAQMDTNEKGQLVSSLNNHSSASRANRWTRRSEWTSPF